MIRSALAALILTTLCIGHPRAAPPPAAADGGVTEMTQLFDTVCLKAFPALPAVSRWAEAAKAKPMTASDVRAYLHDDPGFGWFVTTPLATYALTIEQPPYRACALRRMTPSGFSDLAPYQDLIAGFEATHANGRTVSPAKQTSRTPDGADIAIAARMFVDPQTNRANEVLMLLLTDYHGRYRGVLESGPLNGGPAIEVRMVHQFPPTQ